MFSWLIISYFHAGTYVRSAHDQYVALIFIAFLSSAVAVTLLGSAKLNRNFFLIVLGFFVASEVSIRGLTNELPYYEDSDFYRFPKPYVGFTGLPNGRHIASQPTPMGGHERMQ